MGKWTVAGWMGLPMVFSFLGGDEGGGFSWLVGVVVVVVSIP